MLNVPMESHQIKVVDTPDSDQLLLRLPLRATQSESISIEDFTTDPLGSLTKGWGMFSRAAVKTASMVNESYVQPSVAKVHLPLSGETDDSYKILLSRKR